MQGSVYCYCLLGIIRSFLFQQEKETDSLPSGSVLRDTETSCRHSSQGDEKLMTVMDLVVLLSN